MKKNNFPVTPGLGIENTLTSLKFIQEGMLDRFEVLLKGLSDSYNKVIVLEGCAYNKTGDDYTVGEGAVYYNGEILSVDAFAGNHASNVPVFSAVVNDYTGQNKPIYSDRVFRDTHSERKLTIVMGASGGIMDVVNAPSLTDVLVDVTQNNLGSMLIRTLLGSYTTNDVIKLYGCVITPPTIPGTSAITAGAIFYNDKVYRVDAASVVTTGSETLVFKINTDVSPNVIYLDNDLTGTGIANYNAATVKTYLSVVNGTFATVTYQNSYVEPTGDIGPARYRLDRLGNVIFKGGVKAPASPSSVVFGTLPVGFRPSEPKCFVCGYVDSVFTIYIEINGEMRMYDNAGTAPSNFQVSLAPLRFNIFD